MDNQQLINLDIWATKIVNKYHTNLIHGSFEYYLKICVYSERERFKIENLNLEDNIQFNYNRTIRELKYYWKHNKQNKIHEYKKIKSYTI
jgi:hypothetical protein